MCQHRHDTEHEQGYLMRDFSCTSAKDMYYEVLAKRIQYFKEDEKGVAVMCKVMEDMRNEAARENSQETARSLLLIGKLTYEEIAQATKLTVDEVKELDERRSA